MMAAMDIKTRVEFAADVEQVFAMMTDRAYLEEVCQASHALSYDADVTGTTTSTNRKLPAPDMAQKFVGQTVTVLEETAWGPADASGTRTVAHDGLERLHRPDDTVGRGVAREPDVEDRARAGVRRGICGRVRDDPRARLVGDRRFLIRVRAERDAAGLGVGRDRFRRCDGRERGGRCGSRIGARIGGTATAFR